MKKAILLILLGFSSLTYAQAQSCGGDVCPPGCCQTSCCNADNKQEGKSKLGQSNGSTEKKLTNVNSHSGKNGLNRNRKKNARIQTVTVKN